MSSATETEVWTLDPALEGERITALHSLELLDTPAEDRFDRITRLAAEFFKVPIAYVALMDRDRQWFKSRYGLCPSETTRDISFCQYTLRGNQPLIMPDTRVHPLSKNHPMVVGEPHLRFYAGIPLTGPRGMKIGTFCIVDHEPRAFSHDHVAQLTAFASIVERELSMGQIIQTQNELLNTRQKLVKIQGELDREFADAAKYVRLMLPPPLAGDEILDWQFHPSTHLGGDGLGYRRINDDQLAFYVLDVTGHGLGSALLAVTALEFLRSRVAREIDFSRPAQVVDRLNRTFQMKDHAGKFFSVWYGVYSRAARTITYANAGHPPPILVERQGDRIVLTKTAPGGLVLGIAPEIDVPEITLPFPSTSELLLFTDGLYEVSDSRGGRGSHDEFVAYLEQQVKNGKLPWESMRHWLERARAEKAIDDDVSLMRFAARA